MPEKPKDDPRAVRRGEDPKPDPLTTDTTEAESDADPIHPGETSEAERHDPDPTEHPIQPAGQATSPMSDQQAKDHQRTGDPEADAEETADPDTEDRVRLTTTVPKSVMAELDRVQADHDLNSRGDALALIFDRGAAPGGLVPSVGGLPSDSPGSVDVIAQSATPIEGTEGYDPIRPETPKYSTVNLPGHLQNY